MKKIVAVALLSAVVTLPAYAASGAYAGIKVGGTKVGFNGLSKSSDTGYGVLLGYQYNQNFAFEGEYNDLGRFTTAAINGKSNVWGLSAVGILPLQDKFSVYGKLGLARSDTSTSAATGTKRTAATYGLGGQYDATSMIGLRLSWERYGVGITGQNASDDLYSLAAVFKF
ncbi:MAG TPA: outer membrane beta-barrel protein [Gallionella sp.]|nr:outer membrane beta-barrel protein [Gallionella sp.]